MLACQLPAFILLFQLFGGTFVREHGRDGFKDLVRRKLLAAVVVGSAWTTSAVSPFGYSATLT